MKNEGPKGQSSLIYDEQGAGQVSRQIMDSYNSGVLDPAEHKMKLGITDDTEESLH
ncbi:hypothetical protein [Mesobacillus harenae]|uniref:hypothetical protein n=1 Tax=Mesobacillus harenae TaxID=2213203 RepID=UPI0015810AAB|nr:hypothetical protein [Mesobacillus harenae]